MKIYIVVGLILLVLAGGYFIIKEQGLSLEGDDGQQETITIAMPLKGTVTKVNLDEVALDGPALVIIDAEDDSSHVIAIPSMGILLCPANQKIADPYTVAVGDLIEVNGSVDSAGRIVPCEDEEHYFLVTTFARDASYGFEFTYRKGPDGYITLEDNESTDIDYVTGLTLFNKTAYEELLASTDAREGPPAMHVRVYQNPQKLHAPVWVIQKPLESNSNMALAEPEEAVVGGANATHYIVDGLYPIDTYVVAHGEHIYILSGMYPGTDAAIYKDFQSLVQSFAFIPSTPEGGVAGKIDINVACESALAYSTFASGDEADTFIADCVEGKHPEVINRYINDLGLDGTTI